MLHAVILAGGSGTRLWPLSRVSYPKQFLQLLGDFTLLQQTVVRLTNAVPAERVWVVTSQEQEFLVRSQLMQLDASVGEQVHILVEPAPRNTAAAIGLAAVHIRQRDPQAVMAVLPADHWIEKRDAFVSILLDAVQLAEQGMLVTLGITPDRPETGYGYIHSGRPLALSLTSQSHPDAYYVDRFVEKPDLACAQTYLASGEYYWNAGIFLWQVATILKEIATYLPQLAQGLEEISQSLQGEPKSQALATVYQKLDLISIDYGVLEKSPRLIVVPADIGWSDLGDWTTIHSLSSRDERGNAFGPHVVDVGSENSFVHSNGRLIATIGLKNTVVVDTHDALLICADDKVQEVKTVAQQLQTRGVDVANTPHVVRRPWGTYAVLEEGEGFKVKRITVDPGAALSLQLHHHRNEHWVVVSGTAQVVNGDQKYFLSVGQSTYVSKETRHRLINPSVTPLEIIEVQTGTYLGEDDIVRFDDLYHRLGITGQEVGLNSGSKEPSQA
jgi:mannose-1-phosphate guanylyltransferase/mannose-6-phosphate isomerase